MQLTVSERFTTYSAIRIQLYQLDGDFVSRVLATDIAARTCS